MDIRQTASDMIEKGKAALDTDADGKVEAGEVLDALGKRVQEAAEAAGIATDEVKAGFDADGDGKVSLDEVKVVAEGVGKKAKEAASGLAEKLGL